MASVAYYSSEYFQQQRRLLLNGDPRALICFCVDVSRSMDEYWIQPGGLSKHTGSGYDDGHNVSFFNLSDIRPGYAYYKKIDRLNEVLRSLLTEFKHDPELRSKVAVSIVTYSQYARVKYDFLDCESLDVDRCVCAVDKSETAMGDGLRTALAQIDEIREQLREKNNDSYTPILVFMTDGTPTDDPRPEFEEIRRRTAQEDLYIFPLGIGSSADMTRLRDLYPLGRIPAGFTTEYLMVQPQDYERIFRRIKQHVQMKNRVMVSEGNSVQSRPALADAEVLNNQMGEDLLDSLLSEGII
jgi:uncharacterized protein YegL